MDLTVVVHRGGPLRCNDMQRDWDGPPAIGDRVFLDEGDFYPGVAHVVHVGDDGRVWIYCGDYWGQVLDDGDLLWAGWGGCELPAAFAEEVRQFRARRAFDDVGAAWQRFEELCLHATRTDDLVRQGCENMRESLHKAIDHLRSVTMESGS